MNQDEKIRKLKERIEYLEKVALKFQNEVDLLKLDLRDLQNPSQIIKETIIKPIETTSLVENESSNRKDVLEKMEVNLENKSEFAFQKTIPQEQKVSTPKKSQPQVVLNQNEPAKPFNLEDYIGGNVLGKVGILILIIGIGVFVKYAIDNNLLSPLGRVILAYLAGASLIGIAYWLKSNYKSYSAVLFSGGVAVLYFSTYFAFAFFSLMPQLVAFGLMFLITIYTVWEATRYDEEIISLIGLVGAYSVPILLGGKGGNVAVLFVYMTIINVGVLALSFQKDWNRMNGTAFVLSWLIFVVWFANAYKTDDYTNALTFAFVFFALFYVALVAYQVRKKLIVKELILFAVLVNAVIFYAIGWAVLVESQDISLFWATKNSFPLTFLTLFTLFNACLHAGVGYYLWQKDILDTQVTYLAVGLGITFLTIAAPIYFDAEIITVLWTAETIILFGVGQRQRILFFEYASYVLTIISLASVPFCFDMAWVSLIWFAETLILFATFIRFHNKYFEAFSFFLSIITAISVPFYYAVEWITYFWLIEALVLFGIARFWKSIALEKISYIVLILVFIGLFRVWDVLYFHSIYQATSSMIYYPRLASWLVMGGIVLFLLIHFQIPLALEKEQANAHPGNDLLENIHLHLKSYLFLILMLLFYLTISFEINLYFELQHQATVENKEVNYYYSNYFFVSSLYIYAFSAFYLTAIIFLHIYVLKAPLFTYLCLWSGLALSVFYLFSGSAALIELIAGYINTKDAFPVPIGYILMRFLVYAGLLSLIVSTLYLIVKLNIQRQKSMQAYTIWLNVFALLVLSIELRNYFLLNTPLDTSLEEAFMLAIKFGFTLLWALYSSFLIGFGIWRKRKYLRMTGFAIFGITLLKLFLFDVSYNSTLSVIVAFIGVGILLLIVGFLYQKYKAIILEDD